MTAGNEYVGPRPLRAVRDDDFQGYLDWEAVYQDNATWVYRTLFARVGNRLSAAPLLKLRLGDVLVGTGDVSQRPPDQRQRQA